MLARQDLIEFESNLSRRICENTMTAQDLIGFEKDIGELFMNKEIYSPIHLSGGNESQLIDIFKDIETDAWIFSNWRSHYHALLHGIPRELVKQAIVDGKSMNLNFPDYRFFSSAIVGGILPIACGVAAAGHRVWCFLGDMTASIGAFHDAEHYAVGHDLPITFVIEDNGLATNTPTRVTWGEGVKCKTQRYQYQRIYPHVGLSQHVVF